MKIGVSLGAGGARGYAHIGVLKALEEAGIRPDLLSGSSIGAIIGGAYAPYGDAARLETLAAELVERANIRYFNPFRFATGSHQFLANWLIHAACDVSALRASVYSHRRNRKVLEFIFGRHTFADTAVPFWAVAVDLLSGEVVSIGEGPLVDGILPSISIPGIFPPVERDGMLLVDGGVLAEVPVRELRSHGAEFVIAVRLRGEDALPVRNGFSLLMWLDALKGESLAQWELAAADFVIQVDLPGIDMLRFDSYRQAIEAGYETARKSLSSLKEALSAARI